jgi:hypothetical protein
MPNRKVIKCDHCQSLIEFLKGDDGKVTQSLYFPKGNEGDDEGDDKTKTKQKTDKQEEKDDLDDVFNFLE